MKKSNVLRAKRMSSALSMENVFILCSILIYLELPVDYLVFDMSPQDMILFFVSSQIVLLIGILIVGAMLEIFAKRPAQKSSQIKPLI